MTQENSGTSATNGVLLDSGALRVEMQRRGWQVRQLSEASGVTQPTIRRILRGYPCWGTTLLAIRKAFDENPVRDQLIRRTA